MIYGHAGFMYFFLMPFLMTRGFSFVANVGLVLSAAATPLLLAWAGFAKGFEFGKYTVLVIRKRPGIPP